MSNDKVDLADTPKYEGAMSLGEVRRLSALASGNSQLTRELRYRLKQVNKTMGRQGQTIANLRGELARIREEHSKIDRGELRRLERFEASAKEQFLGDAHRIKMLEEQIAQLRGQHAEVAK